MGFLSNGISVIVKEIGKDVLKGAIVQKAQDVLYKKPKCEKPTYNEVEPEEKPKKEKLNKNLIYCHDCGEVISKKATACPHCGSPIKKPKIIKEQPIQASETDPNIGTRKYPKEIRFRKSKKTKIIWFSVIGAVFILSGIYLLFDSSSLVKANQNPVIYTILCFAIGVISLILLGLVLPSKIKSFYIDEKYRVDIYDGVYEKISVNNEIIYRGKSKIYEFQLDNGRLITIEFDKDRTKSLN